MLYQTGLYQTGLHQTGSHQTGCFPQYLQYKEVTVLFFPKNLSQILNYRILSICRVLYCSIK